MTTDNRLDVLHAAVRIARNADSESARARLKEMMTGWPQDLIIETLLDAVCIVDGCESMPELRSVWENALFVISTKALNY